MKGEFEISKIFQNKSNLSQSKCNSIMGGGGCGFVGLKK